MVELAWLWLQNQPTSALLARARVQKTGWADQLCAQPLEIGRQKNVGNAGAGMRHQLPGELRDKREVFVQAPGERCGGLVVAGIATAHPSTAAAATPTPPA
jgi:hypothetical protein